MIRSILIKEYAEEVVHLDDVRNGFLDTIDICGPISDGWDIGELMDTLADPECPVHTLRIRWSMLSNKNLKILFDRIAQTNIRMMNLEGNHIGDEGARIIASGTLKDSKVHTLHLGYNDLGDSGAKTIHDGIVNITNLSMGSNGLEQFTQDNLIELDLGWNNIGDEGIHLLAEAVNIRTLNLEGNRITDEGAKTIAQKLTNLKTLNISWNDLGPTGLDILRGTSIETITYEGNLPENDSSSSSSEEIVCDSSSDVSEPSSKKRKTNGYSSSH